MDYKIKRPVLNSAAYGAEDLVIELLAGINKVHINHLLVSGPGSYAAHKAMNEFYDELPDLADSYAEQYQGVYEKLLDIKEVTVTFPRMTTAQDCLVYLRSLYNKVNLVQSMCEHSEIINTLDEIKSLINTTKYKLLFLK
jgi:DNA-binding ferritin-like protein